jgi:hypothetical protein
MSGKYAPIVGYPDGVYNFGPRYVTPTPTVVEPSKISRGPPRNSQFAPEGKKERIESRGAVVTRANTRANPRERLPAHPKRTTNAPLTNLIPILRP